MEGMIGEIRMFAGNFAPRGWALCDGQLLPIANNTALFSIIGTIYGGDGRSTFALPNLKGRVAIGDGQGPGLSYHQLGQQGGTAEVVLNNTQIPQHSHNLQGYNGGGDAATPEAKFLAEGTDDVYSGSADTQMASTSNTGGNQGHENRQPYLVTNFIICLEGTYPSRS